MDCFATLAMTGFTISSIPRNQKIIPLIRIQNTEFFQLGNKLAAAEHNMIFTLASCTIKINMALFDINIVLRIENRKLASKSEHKINRHLHKERHEENAVRELCFLSKKIKL